MLSNAQQARARPAALYTFDLSRLTEGNIQDPAFRRRAWDDLQLVACLQGLVNRRSPRLYIYLVGPDGHIDHYWLDRLQDPGAWLAGTSRKPVTDIATLVQLFRRSFRGVVVWDENVPATSNVASTASGIENLIPLRYDPAPGSLYERLVIDPHGPHLPIKLRLVHEDGTSLFNGRGVIPGTKLPSSGSAKCDAYLWAADRYLRTGRCDPTQMGYYPDAFWLKADARVPADRTLLSNHDFFVARRAFFFDLSPWDDEAPLDDPHQPIGTDARTLRTLLRVAYEAGHGRIIHVGGFTPWDQKYTDFTGGKHEGVPTEWRYAEILSCFNAFMDADAPGLNAMANASFFQHFPLKTRYAQPNLPTIDSLKARGLIDASGHVASRTFITIYVGDYDSAAWLYQRIPNLWDDPARGSVPLGWAFDPSLEERFPVGLAYTRQTATPNDTFVAGDSGAGYLNPGYLVPPRKWSSLPSGLTEWARFNERLYRRWDLRLTGFVIDGYAPAMSEEVKEAYARFSPGGVVAQKIPERSLVEGTPFLRMGLDLPADPPKAAEVVAANAPHGGPAFAIYRTILWSPSMHRELFQQIARTRPDIQVVDPYTLMLLLKQYLSCDQAPAPEGQRGARDGHPGEGHKPRMRPDQQGDEAR